MPVGRIGSWEGDLDVLVAIIGRHVTSATCLVYGEDPKTAKVEPDQLKKFMEMFRELNNEAPSLSFKKKDP